MTFPSDLEIARASRRARSSTSPPSSGIRDDELELYGPTKAKVTLGAIHRLEAERRAASTSSSPRSPRPPRRGQVDDHRRPRPGAQPDRPQARSTSASRRLGRSSGSRAGRRRWLQPGHPDGGLQPPPDRRRPRDRRGAQPGRRVHRQQPPPQEPARHRPARDPLAARRRHQRPRAAPRVIGLGGREDGVPARPSSSSPSPPRSWPSSRSRPTCSTCGPGSGGSSRHDHRRHAGHRRGPRRRRRDDRPAARRDQAEPAPDPRGRTRRSSTPGRSPTSPTATTRSSPTGWRSRPTTSSAPRPASGPDMGAEKFFDIKCRRPAWRRMRPWWSPRSGRSRCTAGSARSSPASRSTRPCSRRTSRRSGPGPRTSPRRSRTSALFGIPAVVAINSFPTDTPAEVEAIREVALAAGAATPWSPRTSSTAAPAPTDLAEAVWAATEDLAPRSGCSIPTRRRSARRSRRSRRDLRRRRRRASCRPPRSR